MSLEAPDEHKRHFFEDLERRSRDPTHTAGLRRSFRAAGKLQLRMIRAHMRVAVVDHDLLGLGGAGQPAMAYHAPEVRLAAFHAWLASELTRLEGGWYRPYVEKAWQSGLGAAALEVGQSDHASSLGGRLPHLHQLARQELQGIAQATVQQTARVAAQTFRNRAKAWQALGRAFDKVAVNRVVALCNTIVVRAHVQAKLVVYRAAGVNQVGIIPELRPGLLRDSLINDQDEEEDLVGIRTAGDELVCQECEDFADDSPWSADEAENRIPLHPNCRCSVYPWFDLRFRRDAAGD